MGKEGEEGAGEEEAVALERFAGRTRGEARRTSVALQ